MLLIIKKELKGIEERLGYTDDMQCIQDLALNNLIMYST